MKTHASRLSRLSEGSGLAILEIAFTLLFETQLRRKKMRYKVSIRCKQKARAACFALLQQLVCDPRVASLSALQPYSSNDMSDQERVFCADQIAIGEFFVAIG
jgi:hypothetical protein